jgi:predicted nucleic acid-binding protein
MAYLLDTNILSELRKGASADPHVRKWARSTARERHKLSVLSLGEIRKGIEVLRRRSPDQCAAFERWLETLRTEYARDILILDEGVMEEWGRLMAKKTMPSMDGLIAATARYHNLTVATRNTSDFRNTGVKLVDPFNVTPA